MIVFAFADYAYLLSQLPAAAEKGVFEAGRFANGEIFINLRTPVRMAHCLIIGSVAPPDEQLLSLALLAHTLKKEGCRKLTAVLPYLAYSRQDKDKPGESLAAAWIGSLLMASGVDAALTVDVHSDRSRELFRIPLTSIFPAELFAAAIQAHQMTDATIVAPDNGAVPRCQAVNRVLGRPTAEVPYFEKKRDRLGIKHAELCGTVGPRALIIDDILDTGGTLLSACEKLLQAGAREIEILVTHGLFTGTAWQKLWSLGVQRIFCTDSVPQRQEILDDPRIVPLPIGELLSKQIALLHPRKLKTKE